MRSFLFSCLLVVVFMIGITDAFVVPSKQWSTSPNDAFLKRRNSSNRISLAAGDDDEQDRLSQLGFDEAPRRLDEPEQKVRVDLIEEVDPVTLTAIGFALIAFNFLVFANMGDAGISGFVARIINAST